MSKSKIVHMNDWKERATLMDIAVQGGWGAKASEFESVEDPVAFYICEPLQTGYMTVAMVSRKSIKDLIAKGTAKYGTPDEIFNVVGSCTMDVIKDTNRTLEDIKAVIVGNMINFANTKTGAMAINDDDMKHYGALFYDNPLRRDGIKISSRPIAMANDDVMLSTNELNECIVNYLFTDNNNHPEYFEGINLGAVVQRLM